MKKSTRTQISFIILWAFLIVSFSAVAIFILYEANGYRLNRQTWRLEMAGLIALDGLPKQQVEVKVNGRVKSNVLPFKIAKVLPGSYYIEVSKPGYSGWSKNVRITEGQAHEERKLYLYYSNPSINLSTSNRTVETVKNDAQKQSTNIAIIDNEIWYQEKLLTRFSQAPQSAIISDDKYHIFFQVGNELRVIELDGTNNTKLFDLPTSEKVTFVDYSNKIVFVDQEKVYEVEVR
jgi:hypothetical protein